MKHLLELGLTPETSYKLLSDIDNNEPFESCWRKSLAAFVKQLPIIEEDIIKNGGVFALVGPTGVGKTTTIAKLAARFALRHGKQNVALITTDSYRIGAHEQLRIYGRILDVPVFVANDSDELNSVLKNVQDKRLVLIDTAGMSQRDIRLSEQFSVIQHGSPLIRSFLVLSSTA